MTARTTMVVLLVALGAAAPAAPAAAPAFAPRSTPELVPGAAPEISDSFLGMYRKTMEIEDEIRRHAERYGIDPELARAVCLYESGGNSNLTSGAGARGYFQVMPGTFAQLGVRTNIEAGIKYLSMMLDRFEREDLALAAYNGGPAYVRRQRPMRLETLQYVLGIAYYKNVLREWTPLLRQRASRLRLTAVEEGETWTSLSRRTGIPILHLRMFNPFLASRPLRAGSLFAHPETPSALPLAVENDRTRYRTRAGDLYLTLAFVFDVTPDLIREANGLWHVDMILPGTPILIPVAKSDEIVECRLGAERDLAAAAEACGFEPWEVIRDNHVWDENLSAIDVVRVHVRQRPPDYALYRVRSGDTLSSIAGRHGVTLAALRALNGLSSGHWLIRAGDVLKVPTTR